MIHLLFTAWRNFLRNLRRYRVLLVALVLITAVLTAVLGVVLGVREGLYEKASRYFAGNLVVLGYIGNGNSLIEEPEPVEAAVQRLEGSHGLDLRTYSRRSTYYNFNTIELFFSGYYLKQRRLVGVEWDLEQPVLSDFYFVRGGVPEAGDQSAALISSATAEKLQIGVGDELVASIRSDRGRTNTAELIVRGIFSESSFFGYQTYLHRRTLNRLREAPEERVNEIGVYLKNPIRNEQQAARLLHAELAQDLPTLGVLQTREAYSTESNVQREQREYGVVTVGAQLEEIQDLLGAITIIAGIVILMFLTIVVVGVGNTFTMIVWERTREIGTLRAMGMQRPRAVVSFLIEAAILGLAGVLLGMGIGAALLETLQRGFQFPPNMVTTLFLTRGRLPWLLPPWGIWSISLLVVGASVLGALRAALKAGRLTPVEALQRRK
ncbi:MAG: FtsX-like permease family protein [Spirochaetaceae bacterium]|nr:FtsX-like permease family protein [Spirochaetaceae bacterium]MCF7938735.1 FtsX-like permease family protein [Spirochaetales bacterium]